MRKLLTIVLSLVLLTGCAGFPGLQNTPQPDSASTEQPQATSTPAPTVTSTTTPSGPSILRIWVPPQFDPATETPAGVLFQSRLDEFVARRPGLKIEVRVKSESMLKALTSTQAAAPSIMPDVVALSRADMEAVTMTGILHPFDGLSTLPDDPDWYPYAHQMAHIKNTNFGLPFAGDALILAGYASPLPRSWDELSDETLLVFPAAAPQGLFSLSLYLSAGGALVNEQGLPAVDEEILTDVLAFFEPTDEFAPVPAYVANLQSYDQAWAALLDQRGNLGIAWASLYLQSTPVNILPGPLPALEEGQFTLATGWSWALAGTNLDNQALAVELAEFLSDSAFLAEWNHASGYLSTRPTAMGAWKDAVFLPGLSQTVESAYLIPNQDQLLLFGPLFSQAVQSVVKGENSPAEGARSLVEQVK